jgi:hypothetical protein
MSPAGTGLVLVIPGNRGCGTKDVDGRDKHGHSKIRNVGA